MTFRVQILCECKKSCTGTHFFVIVATHITLVKQKFSTRRIGIEVVIMKKLCKQEVIGMSSR